MNLSSYRRALLVSIVALATAALGACNEQLDAGAACPSLCPGLSVPIRDTVLSPVLAFDTTLVGYPSIGTEPGVLLAARGDTLDVRGVIRFDTLSFTYIPVGDTARPVTAADSGLLRMRLNLTGSHLPASVRFEAYDVDTTADDGNLGAVIAKFRPDRLIGAQTLTRAQITDSLVFPLSRDFLMSKITAGRRLRVGLRVVGSGSVSVLVHTVESGLAAEVRYYVSPDTAVHQVVVSPFSKTPVDPSVIAPDFRDYTIIVKSAVPGGSALAMSIGGVPARRSYLRFNVPQWLLDSSTVVRATLQLTQIPQRDFDPGDTVTIRGQAVAASNVIGDLYRSSLILMPAGILVADSIRVAPADSGLRSVEMNALLRFWKTQTGADSTQRAIVLLQNEEGLHAAQVRFFGARAPAAVRPRLRLSYIPRIEFGVP
jgi:hypothetical protein